MLPGVKVVDSQNYGVGSDGAYSMSSAQGRSRKAPLLGCQENPN